MEVQEKEPLQWHPGFYAGIQIELEQEAEYLTFENEHQLGTKPKEIDVLIIKKEPERQIKKNIGRIFRTYNIVEYKSPVDYLSIDDFYQVYGYACFYKADASNVDRVKISEITITFVCSRYPQKMIKHLQKQRGYQIVLKEAGIYQIFWDKIPMQLIITEKLSDDENLYLRSLTNRMKDNQLSYKLIKSYEKNRDNKLYESVMDLVVRANEERFGGGIMCNALEELMKDRMDEREARGLERGELIKLISLIQKKCKNGKSLLQTANDLEEKQEEIEELFLFVKEQVEKPAEELAKQYQELQKK